MINPLNLFINTKPLPAYARYAHYNPAGRVSFGNIDSDEVSIQDDDEVEIIDGINSASADDKELKERDTILFPVKPQYREDGTLLYDETSDASTGIISKKRWYHEDGTTLARLKTFNPETSYPVKSIELSPEGKLISKTRYYRKNGKKRYYAEFENGDTLKSITLYRMTNGRVKAIGFVNNNHKLEQLVKYDDEDRIKRRILYWPDGTTRKHMVKFSYEKGKTYATYYNKEGQVLFNDSAGLPINYYEFFVKPKRTRITGPDKVEY